MLALLAALFPTSLLLQRGLRFAPSLRSLGLYTATGRALPTVLERGLSSAPTTLRGTVGSASMATAGAAGTPPRNYHPSQGARRAGDYHGVGAPTWLSLWGSGPSHALTESLRSLYRQRVAHGRRWCDHDHPRWGGHNTTPTCQATCARRIGFSHRVGALTLLGSGLLHGSSGTWVSDDLEGHSKSRGQGYADVHG
jgi:hypothetical protein